MRQPRPDCPPARSRWSLILAVTFVVFSSAAAVHAQALLASEPQYGLASWHQGTGRTASGRRWKSEEFVAAHRLLPLGTTVRVVNVCNGRETTVKITDRGPYASGRIIDLSMAAARQLGCVDAGTAQVRLEIIDPASARIAQAALSPVAEKL